jgi:hypothetical protein
MNRRDLLTTLAALPLCWWMKPKAKPSIPKYGSPWVSTDRYRIVRMTIEALPRGMAMLVADLEKGGTCNAIVKMTPDLMMQCGKAIGHRIYKVKVEGGWFEHTRPETH